MPYLDVAGHRLEYEWSGAGPDGGLTLVFLHEGLGSIATWKDFPARLAAATGLSALVYSRIGYGNSAALEQSRAVEFMHYEAIEILPRLLDALEVREAILVGHSDGASIALIYAGNGDHRARALALEAPHVFIEDICIESIARLTEAYRTTDLRARLRRYHGDNVDGAFRGWSEGWLCPAFGFWNIEEYLPGVTCPTLVIQGVGDEYGTPEQLARIHAQLSGPSEVALLADCGHAPHRDQRELVLGMMHRFVRSVCAA